MWIARDKDGWLCLYKEKPVRQLVEEFWMDADINYYLDYKEDGVGCFKIIDSELYPELTWEDEPIEIEILLMKELGMQ